MERWKEMYNYGSMKLHDGVVLVSHNGEYIATSAFFVALVLAYFALAYIGWRSWKAGERERIMKKASHLEEERKLSDAFTEVLDQMHERGELSPERVHYWTKKFGRAFDLTDMIPRSLPDELKKKLKRKRRSNKDDAVAQREFDSTAAPLPDANHQPKEEPKSVLTLFKGGGAAA